DDLLGDVARAGGVAVELHRELAAARGHRAQIADVTEHLRQGRVRLDADAHGAALLAADHAAAAVEVADDVTDVRVRREDVDLHDGLEDLRAGLRHGLPVGGLGRDLEGDGRGVDRVEAAVREGDLHVDDGVAREGALLGRQAEALLDGRDELLGDAAAHDGRLEDEVRARLTRLDAVLDLRVLARATRLLLVGVAVRDRAGDALAVGDLGPA